MPANQTKIMNNLAAWLRLKRRQEVAEEFKEVKNKDLIPKLIAERNAILDAVINRLEVDGLCLGFSICAGAMAAVEKTEWWEDLTDRVEATDVSTANFSKIIRLVDAESECTLEDIFKKCLNYILTSHVIYSDLILRNFMIEIDEYQKSYDHLAPGKNRFQVYGKLPDQKEASIHVIKDQKVAGGNMTLQSACQLLNLRDSIGKICLISNRNHAIQFHMKNGHYYLHDPNYVLKTYYVFTCKQSFIEEIIRRLGNAFVFHIFSLDKPLPDYLFSEYKNLINEQPLQLMKEEGLFLIAKKTEMLESLIEKISLINDIEGPLYIASALTVSYGNTNCFNFVLINSLISAKKILDYARQSGRYYDLIAKALCCNEAKDSSTFGLSTVNSSHLFPQIISDASKSLDWPHYFLQALKGKVFNKFSALEYIAMQKSENLGFIFKYAAEEAIIRNFIAESLTRKVGDWILFHRIVCCHENALPELLKMLAATRNGYDYLAEVLRTCDADGWSGLRILMRYSPLQVKKVLEFAEQSKDFAKHLAKGIAAKSVCGNNIFHYCYSSNFYSEAFTKIRELGKSSPLIAKAITCALTTKDKYGDYGYARLHLFLDDELKYFMSDKQLAAALEDDDVFKYVQEKENGGAILLDAIKQAASEMKSVQRTTEKLINFIEKYSADNKTLAESLFKYDSKDKLVNKSILAELTFNNNKVLLKLLGFIAKSDKSLQCMYEVIRNGIAEELSVIEKQFYYVLFISVLNSNTQCAVKLLESIALGLDGTVNLLRLLLLRNDAQDSLYDDLTTEERNLTPIISTIFESSLKTSSIHELSHLMVNLQCAAHKPEAELHYSSSKLRRRVLFFPTHDNVFENEATKIIKREIMRKFTYVKSIYQYSS